MWNRHPSVPAPSPTLGAGAAGCWPIVVGGDLVFRLPRPALLLYSTLALTLSLGLLLLSQQRGPREFVLWLVAYGGIALLSLRLPSVAPLAGGATALLLGSGALPPPSPALLAGEGGWCIEDSSITLMSDL